MVELRGGLYSRDRTFELSAQDSGTDAAPIVYRARPGETVRLIGGQRVTDWKPVADPAVLQRLRAGRARQGLAGRPAGPGHHRLRRRPPAGGLELFFQDRPMTVARWPNEGFVKIVRGAGPDARRRPRHQGLRQEGMFTYEGDRPRRWAGEKDVWLHGYWFWDWADQRQKVAVHRRRQNA